jgi:lipoprotein NlpD
MRRAGGFVCVAFAVLLVAGCATRRPAPVVEHGVTPLPPQAEAAAVPEKPPEKPIPTHVVKRGETLVGIALQYGLDYRELAAWNGITNMNVIGVGQVLAVAAPADSAPVDTPIATPLASAGPIEARPLANTEKMKVEPRGQRLPYSDKNLALLGANEPGLSASPGEPAAVAPVAVAPPVAPPEPAKAAGTANEDVKWIWPVKGGKVTAAFTEASKGVDIAGKKGTPIQAAADGRVIFAGELRGYGKLVILKHNNTWVSAYAHNDKVLVEEQQDVKRGQKIAEMGSSDTDKVKLHFELRREQRPVDPAKVLPAP